MIRTSLINGVINLDSDFSKYIESLSKPGVIEGFNVQDGVVKPGKARVKAERTNGETIYCYVENTEEVSLSGNDGKVYIVIDQEDIDSGLVREDGSNIARIEEGNDRPTKNFLKIWSKTGAIIKDERDIIKKIDEVNEDIEEEISGIDTRLTEAEHDIQQIIEQSGSALSYLDTTCYAGEEIHENDLIVTNGNSFNPDRTDESTDVGGQTVNKYAIGFIGNGEVTNWFEIKTGIIEGVTPDSVTVNIETDNNGEPSGTALATVDITDVIDNSLVSTSLRTIQGTSLGSTSTTPIFWLNSFGKHNYLDGFFMIHSRYVGRHYKVSQGVLSSSSKPYYFYDESGEQIRFTNTPSYSCTSLDNVIVLSGTINGVVGQHFFRIKGDKCVKFKTIANINYVNGLSKDGKIMTRGGTTSNQNVSIYVCETPYDFDNATVYNTNISYVSSNTNVIRMLEDIDGERYILHQRGTNKLNIYKINSDYTVTKINDSTLTYSIGNNYWCGIENGVATIINMPSTSTIRFDRYKFTGNPYYGGTIKSIFIDSVVSGKGDKMRLTIVPTVTGSVVDSIKIYDKEGEYYSECAVRDLNSWSNVSNKTPYIATNCVKARYARKVNENDDGTLGGFSNGDFTELEPVQYTFQGLKTGFSGLISDTLYYSDGEGGITKKKNLFYVGNSINNNSLLIKTIPSEIEEYSEEYTNSTDTFISIYRYMLGSGKIKFVGKGDVKGVINGTALSDFILHTSSDTTNYVSFSYGDYFVISYKQYSSSSGANFKIYYETD